jgi:hypothetical protein
MQAHDAGASNFNPDERLIDRASVVRLHPAWTFRHVLEAVATATRAYAITDDGRSRKVVVLDARNGQRLHAYSGADLHLRRRDNGSCCRNQPETLAWAGGTLVVGTLQQVLALDPETGHLVWRVQGGATALIISGDRVFTSKLACQNPCGPTAPAIIALHSGRAVSASLEGDAPPVVAAGRLYRQSYAMGPVQPAPTQVYDPSSGRRLATLSLGFSPAWIGDRKQVYATYATYRIGRPSHGGAAAGYCSQLIARISADGKPLWKVNTRGSCRPTEMALAYGIFYLALQMPHSVEVSALAGSTGRLRWRTTIWRCSGPLPFTENCLEPSLAVAHGLLFALNITVGKIASVDAETGRLVHTLNLPAVVRATGGYPHPLMVAGGALYVLGGRGHFLAMLPAPPR